VCGLPDKSNRLCGLAVVVGSEQAQLAWRLGVEFVAPRS
jgi:hypothetical protein